MGEKLRPFFLALGCFGLTAFIFTTAPARGAGFGPYDYYDPPKGGLLVVERRHFGFETEERKRKGNWCHYWGDLDYTLRAFPNHPRALVAMAEYLEEHQACPAKREGEGGSSLTDVLKEIERGDWREVTAVTYFDRAIEFRPNYAQTHKLYGDFLLKRGRLDAALKRLQEAERLAPKNAEIHYALGMAYLEKGDFAAARRHAETSYQLGAKAGELRERLIAKGAWNPAGGKTKGAAGAN